MVQTRYDDITSRVDISPLWFDEHAVPRYCSFEPAKSASIHIAEVALAEIACQECRRRFKVALSAINYRHSSVAEAIQTKSLWYGDPPRHEDDANPKACVAGYCMNSVSLRVLEYWRRHDPRYTEGTKVINYKAWSEWLRDPSLEMDIRNEEDEYW